MFPEDLNTSTSWDLIDPDCDTEVAGITKGQTQPQVDQTVNANTDSTQAKPDRGLEQVSNISLNPNLPEHLWGIGDMWSTHSREQDFMAITTEVEVLHQQLKGKGMYTVPPTLPTTSDTKPSNNVHFQPIDPAHKSPVQTMDQSLLNSSLNLLDNSPRPQSSSSITGAKYHSATAIAFC